MSAFPLLILLALGLAAALSTAARRVARSSVAWRVATVLFAIAAVAYPLLHDEARARR